MPTYSNAYAKVKNWVFDVPFPGNQFKFTLLILYKKKVLNESKDSPNGIVTTLISRIMIDAKSQ